MTEANDQRLLHSLQGLPVHSLRTQLRSPRGRLEYEFKGALLHEYARRAGLVPEGSGAGLGDYYFLATAADGFKAAVAFAEVLPHFSDKQVLLAFEQNGEALRSGVRLVVPGDDLGGRSLHGLASITTGHAEFVQSETRPPSSRLEVRGLVERRLTLTPDDLAALPRTQLVTPVSSGHGRPVAPRTYEGVLLWDVLEHAGLVLDPQINEDVLRRVIVASSSDGYTALLAAGEIEPRFAAGRALVATSRDGRPLDDEEGGLRLVVPFDKLEGRSVKSLSAIEVRQA